MGTLALQEELYKRPLIQSTAPVLGGLLVFFFSLRNSTPKLNPETSYLTETRRLETADVLAAYW